MASAEARETLALRTGVLRECGARTEDLPPLLSYTENPWREGQGFPIPPSFPLADEPQVESWLEYEKEAQASGVWAALQERFVQLRFPIRAGMSEDAAYRLATRRGVLSFGALSPELSLYRPEALELAIHATLAGRVPVLVAAERSDFVALVRAFSGRNEPIPVPDSMGAAIVTGLNNWDRIARYRREWERAQEPSLDASGEDAWAEEFQRLVPRKELYQDRFIILSRGAYSTTSADALGCEEEEWLDLSLAIRREHEFTHYFTYRVFGSMRNHAFDELLADFVGLVRGLGSYPADWALRFLGLEGFPDYREGGRLESYRGLPPLPEGGFRVLQALTYRSARNLEIFFDRHRSLLGEIGGLAQATFALAGLGLEELASSDMADRAASRLGALPPLSRPAGGEGE
jgi:hypothetical protein